MKCTGFEWNFRKLWQIAELRILSGLGCHTELFHRPHSASFRDTFWSEIQTHRTHTVRFTKLCFTFRWRSRSSICPKSGVGLIMLKTSVSVVSGCLHQTEDCRLSKYCDQKWFQGLLSWFRSEMQSIQRWALIGPSPNYAQLLFI